ncbi:MAG: substrate-binding domain-containing protein, partial [Lentisphaerota bacterium]
IVLIAPPLDIFLHNLRQDHVPLVLCACRPANSANSWSMIDTVTMNNRSGFRSLMDHLRAKGRRDFLHVGGPADVFDAQERKLVFKEYVDEHAADIKGRMMETLQTMQGGREVIQRHLQGQVQPDAIIAVNDLAAMGALQALQEQGIRVPEDVAVTGCDDDTASGIIGLTTLRMPMVELGCQAARLLFDRINKTADIEQAHHVALDFTLMSRKTG